jgi:hypothetical protein
MAGNCIVPATSKFGIGIVGPSAGGPTTFDETFSVSREREVALVQIIASFWDTGNAHTQSALLEVDWVSAGQRVAPLPTPANVETAPIVEVAVTGRQIVAFPFPLPVPSSPDGSGLRMDVRLVLSRISAGCANWRVFMSWAGRDENGIWRV